MANTRKAQVEATKPKRVPMGHRNVLKIKGLTDNELFHYHLFNDVEDRLYRALEAGYAFVSKEGLEIGDKNIDSVRGTDSIMKKNVGGGLTAYLMRIPMEFYKEDQKAKQDQVAALEREIKKPAIEGGFGGVKIGVKDHA